MESLIIRSREKSRNLNEDRKRYLYQAIPWKQRLIGIIGARGNGKTTMLLQRLKEIGNEAAIYITLDDVYFSANSLIDVVVEFRAMGGKYLFIDEVHKYPNWAQELKNIYDSYPELFIVFTGSSALDIFRQQFDLSRRVLIFELFGLSLREFIEFETRKKFSSFSLQEIIKNHVGISESISEKIKILPLFRKYLKEGYYPYYFSDNEFYFQRVENTVKLILENDLNYFPGYDPRQSFKIKQLLYILSTNLPFIPNITKLSERTEINRTTLLNYIVLLERAGLIKNLYPDNNSISILQKPSKIYLQNTNLSHVLSDNKVNIGTIRETFFINQMDVNHSVSLPKLGDFLIDNKFTFEIGGKDKSFKSLDKIKNGFIAADDIENGVLNKIPLWLFGFLY